jgi:hypothetical protein
MSTLSFGKIPLAKLVEEFGETTVRRVLSLIEESSLNLKTVPITVSAARNDFSGLLRAARKGHVSLVGPGETNPVVIMTMRDLLKLLCVVVREITGDELLARVPPAPPLPKGVRVNLA